ncbi:MAG: glycerol-3-phosphate acyltransferase [Desulfatitalea sp.]|nr:glycerol-3-phosphate acyltransferase [Desulfatitalea sp.]
MLFTQLTIDTFPLAGFLFGMALAYLAGSVNFAIALFLLLGREDPRHRFSGNPGVSNVYRQAGAPLAALVLLLDVGRAVAVALLAVHFWPVPLVPWAGWALILGTRYPCLHQFQGGKGVANYIGFCGALMPLSTALALVVYLIVFAFFRRSFIGSFGLLAVLAAAGLVRWWPEAVGMAAVIVTVGMIVWFHRGNIRAWRQLPSSPAT